MILFNGHGWRYNDSPRMVFEYIKKHHKNFKCVWALEDPEKYNIDCFKKVKMDSFQYFLIALKSKYWVSCVNIERGLKFKKKETIYLNTWHGIPLKYIGSAVSKRNDFDFSHINIFCYSSNYEKNIYIRDFNIKPDSLLLSGLPRNDELFGVDKSKIERLKKELKLPLDKKIILYAPTWRDSADRGTTYTFNPNLNFNEIEKALKEDYIFLLRTHAYTNKVMGVNFNDFVYDYSMYPDVNDLLIIADLLITDYSATLFDFSILEKPILCYGFDYKEYSKERGLYIDIKNELYEFFAETQSELIDKIKYIDYQKASKTIKSFKKRYIQVDGNATEKCVKALLNYKEE